MVYFYVAMSTNSSNASILYTCIVLMGAWGGGARAQPRPPPSRPHPPMSSLLPLDATRGQSSPGGSGGGNHSPLTSRGWPWLASIARHDIIWNRNVYQSSRGLSRQCDHIGQHCSRLRGALLMRDLATTAVGVELVGQLEGCSTDGLSESRGGSTHWCDEEVKWWNGLWGRDCMQRFWAPDVYIYWWMQCWSGALGRQSSSEGFVAGWLI